MRPRQQQAVPPAAIEAREITPAARRFALLHEELRTRIVLYRYPPGHRLDLDQIAREFDVSRTPVRSVLQRLALEGLVVMRHGVPTTVSAVESAQLRQFLAFRMRLAELVGELDPLRPTAATLALIDEAAARASRLGEDPDLDAFTRIDLLLHAAVHSLIGNAPLRDAYDQAYYLTVRMWRLLLPSLDWASEVALFTREIELQRAAFRRGDVRAVGFNTRNALSAVLYRLEERLSPRPDP